MKLKKLFLTLSVALLWFVWFWNCKQFFSYNYIPLHSSNWTYNYVSYDYSLNVNSLSDIQNLCFSITSNQNCSPFYVVVSNWTSYNFSYDSSSRACVVCGSFFDSLNDTFYLWFNQSSSSVPYARLTIIDNSSYLNSFQNIQDWGVLNPSITDCPVCEEKLTSLQCQSEYDLIPVSDVDENYCLLNELCPVNWDFSRFVINWEDQLPSLLYEVSIPDYITYDYNHYSNQISRFIVNWYNEDTDYIQWIIDTQNYTPNSEDFTNVFMNIIPYMKIIVFVLFLLFVYKMIKKLFK